ncbi:MAG: DUF4256 domain-containing protein [Ginsengibacter sp.]
MDKKQKQLSEGDQKEILRILEERFVKNKNRHKEIDWSKVKEKLEASIEKLWSLNEMEKTGGEPDVVSYDKKTNKYIFFDCSAESPKGRRSVCYDGKAMKERKEHPPKNNALGMAAEIGIKNFNRRTIPSVTRVGRV